METQAVRIAYSSRATKFKALVETAYAERNTFPDFEGTLESTIKVQFSKMSAQNHLWKRDTFRQLLLMMYAKKCYAVLRNPSYIEILANISTFGNKAVRDIESWTKDSLVAEGQLQSLIRYCFARYDVPAFMENVFVGESKVQMLWYIQLGRGDSVQALCGFPVKFTTKMAHEFRNTPGSYEVNKAIRRAQALGFGADAQRAEAIAWSLLSESFQHEDFYSTVVQFVVNAKEEVAFDVLQQVLQYIAVMRKENTAFNMKGRTWVALARQSAEWHIEMAKQREAEGRSQWKAAPIANYTVEDGDCAIRIIQLLTSEALYEEGADMGHCVAEYEYDCNAGTTAIFSVRKFTKGQQWHETLATVEVFLEDMEIVQAKARFNEMICETAHAIIGEWAQREKLAVCYEYRTAAELAQMQQAHQGEAQIRQMDQQPGIYRPYNAYDNRGDGDGMHIVRIVFIIIKILIIVAKCSN